MPARYPPIDRLPPLQVRRAAAEDAVIEEAADRSGGAGGPGGPGRSAPAVRSGPGRREADRAPRPGPVLGGRLAGLDAFRGLAFLIFAWLVLLPVPLKEPAAGAWSGPAAAVFAGFEPRGTPEALNAGVAGWLPSLLLAAALFAMGAGIPLAAARRGRPGGRRLHGERAGLLAALPERLGVLLLVALLVPVMRPETLGTGPAAALSLLGLLGLIPLAVRLDAGVGRAARWTLRAGGLGVCLLVLCLRVDVPETRSPPWAPDPVVLALAWNGLFAAVLWLLIPGGRWIGRALRLAVGLGVASWFLWLPPLRELVPLPVVDLDGRGIAGLPLRVLADPLWLLGLGFAAAGTVAGDLGVRHLREVAPPPPGALPREDADEVRWGTGGVVVMVALLLAAPAAGLALGGLATGWTASVAGLAAVPAHAWAAAVALVGVCLARLLMAGPADAAGRWARSLCTVAAALLLSAAAAGLVGAFAPAGAEAAGVLALWLGVAGGLTALLTALTAPLDRPAPVVPLRLALPLTGVGRNPLLLYALLAGPALVLFGYPWIPVGPGGAATGSVDGWVQTLIFQLYGPDASPVHGIGYGLVKALVLAVPVALLSRGGVVLRA